MIQSRVYWECVQGPHGNLLSFHALGLWLYTTRYFYNYILKSTKIAGKNLTIQYRHRKTLLFYWAQYSAVLYCEFLQEKSKAAIDIVLYQEIVFLPLHDPVPYTYSDVFRTFCQVQTASSYANLTRFFNTPNCFVLHRPF